MTEYVIASQVITLIASFFYLLNPGKERIKYYIAGSSVITAIVTMITFAIQTIKPSASKQFIGEFLDIGNHAVPFIMISDSMSMTVNCVVCIVAAMANVFSIGYLRKNLENFLCLLNTLPMLMVFFVSSGNLMQMYIFWQLMSVVTYFLISFDQKQASLEKGFRFFATNKLGDAGFLISMVAVLHIFKSLTFENINKFSMQNDTQLEYLEITALIMMISIFVKSMQFGAMSCARNSSAAHVPAISIIQSSTIMVSGTIVIIRLQLLFECSEIIQIIMISMGLLSSMVGALSAIFEKNIKKILAYSSVSHIGLMLAACGFSAYGAAIMLFVTHAFSKSLLVFSAGSVIKSLSGEHNTDNMGGLLELMPKTYMAFVIATVSMVYIPLLPTYYSYRIILSEIVNSDLPVYYSALMSLMLILILTTIYLFRLIYSIFHGSSKIDEKSLGYVNEEDSFIIIPIYILMFFAIFSGVIFYYAAYTDVMWKDIFAFSHSPSRLITIAFTLISFVGIACSIVMCKSIKTQNTSFISIFSIFLHKYSNVFHRSPNKEKSDE